MFNTPKIGFNNREPNNNNYLYIALACIIFGVWCWFKLFTK